MSRIIANEVLINVLLISSDPLLLSIQKVRNKYHLNLSSEAKSILELEILDDFHNICRNYEDNLLGTNDTFNVNTCYKCI